MHTTSFHRTVLSLFFLCLCSNSASAQIMQKFGDNSTSIDNNAVLELESKTKGFLLPRMTKVQRDAIDTPPEGLMIWCTDCSLSNGPEVAIWISDSWTGLLVSNLAENNILKGNPEGKAAAVPFSDGIKYSSADTSEIISTSSSSDVLMPGMTKSPEPGTYLVFFNSQYSISPANTTNIISTAQGIVDLGVIYNEINNLPVTNSSHPIAIVTGEILTPGVYSFPGALSIAGTLTLNAQNNPDAVFVFKTVGAFNTGAAVEVVLINGASASNIYWLAEGAIGLGAGTIMKGTLISHGAAVAVGAGSLLEGRMLSTAGAIAFGPGTVSLPLGPSFINFRTLNNFVMFTAAGGLGNTGTSYYNGDIATGLGALTGFETAIISGTVFPPEGDTTVITEIDGIATFSIYQNGGLIPNSSRVRTTKLDTVDVSLQAIATVAQGETIDVKWNIDAGTLSVKNRILTVIKVQ